MDLSFNHADILILIYAYNFYPPVRQLSILKTTEIEFVQSYIFSFAYKVWFKLHILFILSIQIGLRMNLG